MVQVHFSERNMTLAYYNDRFDLHCGDLVYVDGKLAGVLGCVVEVNYNFKIKISEYKRVIAVVDTAVHGQFYMTGSHFITFDPTVLPAQTVSAWFLAPDSEEEEIVSGSDDSSFRLEDLKGLNVSQEIAERGRSYYLENRVRYLSLNGTQGYAIVEGTKPYEVEFEYNDGEIRQLTCSCFCSYNCKHEVAAMLQLREILEQIEANYAEQFQQTGYFAAVNKRSFFFFVLDGKETGGFLLT
jgi:hypothetical protein